MSLGSRINQKPLTRLSKFREHNEFYITTRNCPNRGKPFEFFICTEMNSSSKKLLTDLLKLRVQRDTSLQFIPAYSYERLGQRIESPRPDNHEPTVPALKILLYSCSPYFRALYTNWQNTLEKRDIVGIPDVPFEVLKSVVEFTYTRETQIDDENVEMVLKGADQLMIGGMVDDCENYLINSVCYQNCIGFLKFGLAHGARNLASEAQSFLLYNFEEVSTQSEELLELTLEEALQLFRNDYLNVRAEEIVWRSILRWIEYDRSNRILHAPLLLKTARLGLLGAEYIDNEIAKHPYVSSNRLCAPVISDVMSFFHDMDHLEDLDRVAITPDFAIPRIPHDLLFTIGGSTDGDATDAIEVYDTRADRWTRVLERDPLGPRANHGCVVIGQEIYVIGGFNGTRYFRSCRCFNVITRTWRAITPMNRKRCYVSVAQLDGFIYAIGGYDGYHRLNSVERYDISINQWSYVSPMHFQRSDACATSLNDLIYVTGGFNGQMVLDSVEFYDPGRNDWTLIPSMKSPRSEVSCVTHEGCLYVIGGVNGVTILRTGEMFSPGLETWVSIPDMRSARSNFGMQVIDDTIFAVGGYNGFTTTCEVEYFNLKTGQWSNATDMSRRRSALELCLVRQVPNAGYYAYSHRDQLAEEKRQHLFGPIYTIEETDFDLEEMQLD